MDDKEFDQIDDPRKNRQPELMVPRPRDEKRAAKLRQPAVSDWENHIPATMIDPTYLPITGDDHAA